MTPDQKRVLRRWSGLKDALLDDLSRLDADAIERGCRFSAARRDHIESRAAAKAIRSELGLDHFGRPPPPPLLRDYSTIGKDPF